MSDIDDSHPGQADVRLPWFVRAVAIFLIVYAGLATIGFATSGEPLSDGWWIFVTTSVIVVIGYGLLRRRRWAWAAGVVLALLSIEEALRGMIFLGDRPYVGLVSFWTLLVPGVVILLALWARRTRTAFMREKPAT
jgi:quinol-cytochrome oxidoreductase complex cytochrome b subunit